MQQIYHDNDLKVEVCGTCWTYNPAGLCIKAFVVSCSLTICYKFIMFFSAAVTKVASSDGSLPGSSSGGLHNKLNFVAIDGCLDHNINGFAVGFCKTNIPDKN